MPNVLLTERCVRSCPYCFAKRQMSENSSESYLSWEDLIYIVDLCEDAHQNNLTLLGGEPTLHPHFGDFLLYLLERGFNARVFTSGILCDGLQEELYEILQEVSPERVSFVCNLNDPAHSSKAETGRVEEFLKTFGNRVTPGFNIWRADFSLDFLIHYINAYGLQRSLRIGIAHPTVGKYNQFIPSSNLAQVITRLISYFPKFERFRIHPGLDCGFPLCKFSEQDIGKLYCLNGGDFRFGCAPAIDIGSDMSVWACFPLSSFRKRSVYEFDHLDQVYAYYSDCFRDVRAEVGGIFEECDHCLHRESGRCAGGCLAHSLNQMEEEAPVRGLLQPPPCTH